MKKYNLRRIMRRAYYIFRTVKYLTWSEALKQSWFEAKEAIKNFIDNPPYPYFNIGKIEGQTVTLLQALYMQRFQTI